MKKLEVVPNSNSAEELSYIYNELFRVESQISELKEYEGKLKAKLTFMFSDRIKEEYAQKPEPFGTVKFEDQDREIVFTTPKRVSYDQDGLKSLYEQGAPVTVEYSLNENVFKALDDAGKAAFMPYRTVEPGNMSVKVKEV